MVSLYILGWLPTASGLMSDGVLGMHHHTYATSTLYDLGRATSKKKKD